MLNEAPKRKEEKMEEKSERPENILRDQKVAVSIVINATVIFQLREANWTLLSSAESCC